MKELENALYQVKLLFTRLDKEIIKSGKQPSEISIDKAKQELIKFIT